MTGQTVTHYRIGEKLGEGGSAVVYRAEDLALAREVVIKFFMAEGAGSIARFQHEARTISSLNHPNICTIYEIGEHQGRPFLAMELLDGQVLSSTIGGRPLKTEDVIDLGTQIADALDAAHTEGIVHRDVKPANIFVTRSGRIKLLDFGVAVMLPRRVDPTTARSLFSTGGTIPYMSPEQARVEDLDHRTDLFSLGIVLYEMATGRRPFAGTTAADVLAAIVNQLPIAPRTLNPSVPAELERIITKALEKNPALRSQTASDIRADLQRLKRDVELAAATAAQAGGRRLSVPSVRTSIWLGGVAAVGVVAVAGMAWWAIATVRGRSVSAASVEELHEPPRADVLLHPDEATPKEPPRETARPATPPPVTQATLIAPVRPDPPSPGPAPLVIAPRVVETVPVEAPRAEGPDQFLIARQQIDLKLYDQAIESLRKVAQGGDRQQAIEASFLTASIHDTRGDTPNAMSTYIEIAHRFPDDPRAAEALVRLAEATLKSKRRDKEPDARKTLTEVVEKYPRSPWAPRALVMRGDLEAREGTYQRDEVFGGSVPTAAITYRAVVERYASSDASAAALNKLARIYADSKRFDVAAATFQELGTRDAEDRFDAWFTAGEIYEKRLKDSARAKTAYARVLPSSPHYAEARKRIAR
jgi:TolA-binding protein